MTFSETKMPSCKAHRFGVVIIFLVFFFAMGCPLLFCLEYYCKLLFYFHLRHIINNTKHREVLDPKGWPKIFIAHNIFILLFYATLNMSQIKKTKTLNTRNLFHIFFIVFYTDITHIVSLQYI